MASGIAGRERWSSDWPANYIGCCHRPVARDILQGRHCVDRPAVGNAGASASSGTAGSRRASSFGSSHWARQAGQFNSSGAVALSPARKAGCPFRARACALGRCATGRQVGHPQGHHLPNIAQQQPRHALRCAHGYGPGTPCVARTATATATARPKLILALDILGESGTSKPAPASPHSSATLPNSTGSRLVSQ